MAARERPSDPSVCSEPVPTEDGGEVVICQQNVGPGSQVGGGEYKRGDVGRTPEDARDEQERLEEEAPVDGR
jgi:hypothetical protein